jgi:hypothetical protein
MPADVTKTPVPAAITTPSAIDTPMGTLEFTDGTRPVRRRRSCATTSTMCTASTRS